MPRPRTLLFAFVAVICIIMFARSTSSSDKSFYDNTVERLHMKQENEQQHKMGTAAVKEAKLREAAQQLKFEVEEAAEERRKKDNGDSVVVINEDGTHGHAAHAGERKPEPAQKVMGGVDDGSTGSKAKENKPHEVGTSRGKWTGEDEVVETKPEKTEQEERIDAVLESILKRSPIIIFSKTYCPYSKKAKAVFAKYKITPSPFIVEIDRHELGAELQDKLLEATGRRTVPNVLINGKSIGGGDDVQALHDEGELLKKIKEMGGKRIVEARLRD